MTRQQKVLETLRKHPKSTAQQLAAKSGVKLGTVTSSLWHLTKSKKAYVIDHGGRFKSARYVAGTTKKELATPIRKMLRQVRLNAAIQAEQDKRASLKLPNTLIISDGLKTSVDAQHAYEVHVSNESGTITLTRKLIQTIADLLK